MLLAIYVRKMGKNTDFKGKCKKRFVGALRILRTSAAFVLVVAVVSVVYASFTRDRFWPAYIFNANLIIGAFLIMAGIVVFALPVYLKKNPLLDHTTHAPMHLEAKMKKRERAYMLIYVGICNVVITVIAQYILSLLWR